MGSWASIGVGAGTSSTTSGRIVPALTLAYNAGGWSLSASSVGVKSGYSYQSSYTLAWYSTWKLGTLLNGGVNGGFGVGGFYSKQGFKESTSASMEEVDDIVLGPSLKITYYPFSMVFVSLEGIYGLRSLANVALNFQDVVMFSLGVEI